MVDGLHHAPDPAVVLRHKRDNQWIEVKTAGRNERRDSDWQALHRWFIVRLPSPEDLTFPMDLPAERSIVPIAVDGVDVEFVVIGEPLWWVGNARVGERDIEIDARNTSLEELSLETVDVMTEYWIPPTA